MLKKLFEHIFPSNYPSRTFNISDAEFFCALLNVIPDGSLLDLDQCEPESWVSGLQSWRARAGNNQVEADNYRIEPDFLVAMRQLLINDPAGLNQCHHIKIISSKGNSIFSSLDNFQVVNISPEIAQEIWPAINSLRFSLLAKPLQQVVSTLMEQPAVDIWIGSPAFPQVGYQQAEIVIMHHDEHGKIHEIDAIIDRSGELIGTVGGHTDNGNWLEMKMRELGFWE